MDKMFRNTKEFYKKSLIFLLGFIIVATSLLMVFKPSTTFAASNTEYSNVLYDLKKDDSFNVDYYPVKENDYSLQLIQIAEGDKKELYAYVYQPSGQSKNYKASSINISTSIGNDISYKNYKLNFCNSNGTLYKYVVEGFTLLEQPTRYYSITEILRPFDKEVDNVPGGDNTISEVPYKVAKLYQFSLLNGKPFNQVKNIDVIEITDKFVGFIRYDKGYYLANYSCDAHFVAFDTDLPIDCLLEADVEYKQQHYSYSYYPTGHVFNPIQEEFGSINNKSVALKSDDYGNVTSGGIFQNLPYKWKRIQTVNEFITNESGSSIYEKGVFDVKVTRALTEEGKKNLQGKKWVLRFTETNYNYVRKTDGEEHRNFDIVGDVMILRLKFVTDGVTYNLGTIDNKQTGSGTSSGGIVDIEIEPKFPKIPRWLLVVILTLILVVFLGPILPYIIQFIVWIISLPFKLLTSIFVGFGKLSQRSKEKPGKVRSNVVHIDEKNITKKGKYKR